MNLETLKITYGTHEFDFAALPVQSLTAMVKRGLTHYLGSEQASKVTRDKAQYQDDNAGAEMSEADINAAKAEYVASAIAALQAGTVGTSTRGPSLDPVEAEVARIAKAEINTVLKANGATFKKVGEGDTAKRVVTFANGDAFTMAELVERRLAAHGERIRKEAEKAVKKASEQAAKSKVASAGSVADLGL